PGEIASWAIGGGTVAPGAKGAPPERCFRYLNGLTWDLKVGRRTCNLRDLEVDLEAIGLAVPVKQHITLTLPDSMKGVWPGTESPSS
ncbi:MAG: hypothetical protein ACRDV4_10200, partial [Acidimicrobiales bacterium]